MDSFLFSFPFSFSFEIWGFIASFFSCGLLAISGNALQFFFQNPLMEPYFLGSFSGASLGLLIWCLLFFWMPHSLKLHSWYWASSFFILAGSLLSLFLPLGLSRLHPHKKYLPLFAGLLLIQISTSLWQTIGHYLPRELFSWAMAKLEGNFWGLGPQEGIIFLFFSSLSLLGFLRLAPALNIIRMGDHFSQSLGVNLPRIQLLCLGLVALTTSFLAYFIGPISFVGLFIPHFTRLFFPLKQASTLLILSFIFGGLLGIFLAYTHLIFSQWIFFPLNSLLSVFGGIFLLFIVKKTS